MIKKPFQLLLQTSPFLRRGISTPRLMGEVILATIPVIFAACWYFGWSALLLIFASVAGAMLAEWFFSEKGKQGKSLFDGSGLLTGILLGLTLPPGMAMWMAFLGGVVGISLGKLVMGGLGQNMFNPALVGRAFLQAAFPTAITTWNPPSSGGIEAFSAIRESNLAAPFMQSGADAVTTASPLGLMKFEQEPTPWMDLLIGNTAGSLGETCAVVIILMGIIMAFRRDFDWRIPVSILLAVAAFSAIPWLVKPSLYPTPWAMILSGGLLFGAVYMATDPVTSPVTPKGAWIFGASIGLLVVLIRLWGGLPEGVMYAILLMNAATPLIERIAQPRVFGRGRAAT
ncbi:MAG TPA: RnfABCDGE type electron transport complex subunit D [Phycisphaerales bacterium]|nr:RnfABCDGE type electron transport complex subunit D [Phycisphaerales bacterium]